MLPPFKYFEILDKVLKKKMEGFFLSINFLSSEDFRKTGAGKPPKSL